MKRVKKLLCSLTILAMIFTLLPTGAFAANNSTYRVGETTSAAVTWTRTKESSTNKGNTVTYGSNWLPQWNNISGLFSSTALANMESNPWDARRSVKYLHAMRNENGAYVTSSNVASMLGHDAATWKHWGNNNSQTSARLFRGKFSIPAGYDALTDNIKLVSKHHNEYANLQNNPKYGSTGRFDFNDGDIVPVNDCMFVFVHPANVELNGSNWNEYFVFWAGNTGTTFLGQPKVKSVWAKAGSYVASPLVHTDGWVAHMDPDNIGQKLTDKLIELMHKNQANNNDWVIDVITTDYASGGGMDELEIVVEKTAGRLLLVRYYKDEVDNKNYDKSNVSEILKNEGNFLGYSYVKDSEIDKYLQNGTLTLKPGTNDVQLNYKKSAVSGDYLDGVQQGTVPYTVTSGINVVDVVYAKKAVEARADYEVRYYTNSVSSSNLYYTAKGNGVVGSTIPVDVNFAVPSGYVAPGHIADGSATVISADSNKNIVHVVYLLPEIGYEVRYYRDSVSNNNYIASANGTGTFGQDIPVSRTLYAPAGYKTPGEIVAGSPTKIGMDPSKNIVNVVYKKTIVNYAYEVRYYKDSVNQSNLVGTHKGSGEAGTLIDVDLNMYAPAGYKTPGEIVAGSATVISIDESRNIVSVLYSPEVVDYSYEIYYFKDDILQDNYLGSDIGRGAEGSTIPVDLNKYAPSGYKTPGKIMPGSAIIISKDINKNLVYVVYTKEETDYAYQVLYFKDSIGPTNFVGIDSGKGPEGSTIPVDLTLHAPAGYKTPGEIVAGSATIISSNSSRNYVYVIYKAEIADYAYEIFYYKDGIIQENFVGSETGRGTAGSAIPVDQTKYAPAGYKTPGEIVPGSATIISTDESKNIVYVVYTKESTEISYFIEYWYEDDFVNDEVLIIQTGPHAAKIGDRITLTDEQLNMYKAAANSNNLDGVQVNAPEIIKGDGQVIKVIYPLDVAIPVKVTHVLISNGNSSSVYKEETLTRHLGDVLNGSRLSLVISGYTYVHSIPETLTLDNPNGVYEITLYYKKNNEM